MLACYKALVSASVVDVAILGGGFAGLATAWELAERGVRALVLEREPELGRHASGRGAGLGRQLAEDDTTTELTVRGAALLRERFPHAWSPTGGILGFDDPEHAEAYRQRALRFGIPHEMLTRAAVAAHWPLGSLAVRAAIFVPSDGVIDTHALLVALASRADVRLGVEVVGVSDGQVETSQGVIAAGTIVDATGAWAGQLTGDPPLAVLKRHLFTLEVAAAATTPFFWHLGAHELYLRASAGGVLASPCDAEATPACAQVTSPDADARLRARLATLPFAGAPILRRWACQRAFTGDRQMRLGRDAARPWLVWAAGLGGHGATAAAAVGERVALAAS
jgi:glycine/D-amino acid oxidase-like deaminating enzyme